MFSDLISEIIRADKSNYTHNRNGYKICKLTPHHMAGKLTGAQCAKLFRNPSRNASANYCIGYDGEIVGCVDEEFRAWTSSNRTNDYQAITVEVSNNGGAPDWTISDASWNALVELAVDVCKRYNFRLVYDGTPNGSLTRHNMFAKTTCPGPYLQGRFEELVDVVNARLTTKPQYPGTLIRLKSKGSNVKMVQKRLIELGYSCGRYGADGIFGKDTKKAVMSFQRTHGLGVDGIVGPLTWDKLF